jgi:hypothetical protein
MVIGFCILSLGAFFLGRLFQMCLQVIKDDRFTGRGL